MDLIHMEADVFAFLFVVASIGLVIVGCVAGYLRLRLDDECEDHDGTRASLHNQVQRVLQLENQRSDDLKKIDDLQVQLLAAKSKTNLLAYDVKRALAEHAEE